MALYLPTPRNTQARSLERHEGERAREPEPNESGDAYVEEPANAGPFWRLHRKACERRARRRYREDPASAGSFGDCIERPANAGPVEDTEKTLRAQGLLETA